MSRRYSIALLSMFLLLPGLAFADSETDRKILNTLIASLRSEDPDSRIGAAREIGSMGAAAAPALPELSALLRDENPSVQNQAARALKKITKDAEGSLAKMAMSNPDFVPALRDVLEDENGMFNKTAAQILDNTVAALAHQLPEADAEQRVLIAQIMGDAGERGASVLQRLSKNDPSPEVRALAEEIAAEIKAASTTG